MYMLYLYRRVIFGTITREDLRGMLAPLAARKAVFASRSSPGAVVSGRLQFVPHPDPRLGRQYRAARHRRAEGREPAGASPASRDHFPPSRRGPVGPGLRRDDNKRR